MILNMKKLQLGVLSLPLLLAQTGCDTVRNTLGLDHYQADAFAVPTNPPLILPPDYNLRPPAPGAAPTYAQTSQTQAQETLINSSAKVYSGNSSETGLISSTGAGEAQSDIRKIVDEEAEREGSAEGKANDWLQRKGQEAKKNLNSLSGNKKAADAPADSKPTPAESSQTDSAPPTKAEAAA